MLTMFHKVYVHVLKYKSHMNLEIYVIPTTYAHQIPQLYYKLDLWNVVLQVLQL